MEKIEEIEKLNEEIKRCKKCRLFKTRIQTVPGNGNLDADIMCCAESPGKTEDEQGIPLCGRSGQLYDIWLKKELHLRQPFRG